MRAAVLVFALFAGGASAGTSGAELRVETPPGFHPVVHEKNVSQAFATDDRLAAITVLNPDLSPALFSDEFLGGVRRGLEKRGAIVDSSAFVDVQGTRWAKVVAHYRDRDEYMEQWFTLTTDHIGQIVLASHASRAAADSAVVAQVVRNAHGVASGAGRAGAVLGVALALAAVAGVVVVALVRGGKKKTPR